LNKVFLSGTIKKQPEIVYTPRGEKLFMFPLWVDKGAFSIDVVFMEDLGMKNISGAPGGNIIVSGELAKASGKSHNPLRLMAHKIIWMEE
jgi:primosomal replication protein N